MDILGYIKAKQRLAPNTLRNYQASLELLDRKVAGAEPTNKEIEAFLNQYASASTLQRHKAAIVSYWEWRYPDIKWPFDKDQFRSKGERLPKFFKPEWAMKMLEVCHDHDDYMFVYTLFMLGCRLSELIGDEQAGIPAVQVSNVSIDGIRVIAKGNREIFLYMTSEFRKQLMGYLFNKTGVIFPKSKDYYYELIKRLGAETGHPEVTPHHFRHARAQDLRSKGMDRDNIQKFLHHKNPASTAVYLEVSQSELKDQLEKIDGK